MDSTNLNDYHNIIGASSSRRDSSSKDREHAFIRNYGLSTKEALSRLHHDMKQEVVRMKYEFSKRNFFSWLGESISFKSELSKMRWPSVVFMTAQAIAHFVVAFILDIDNLATGWVGFQGFIITALLVFNLGVNVWDTKLRYKELLMKSEQILNLIKQCSEDKQLLKQWKLYNWSSAHAKVLFIPKSPCVHQTLTYRDESCLNLPDYLLVKGDIIHLYPGERAPADCVGLKPAIDSNGNDNSVEGGGSDKIILQEGQIFHDDHAKRGGKIELDSDSCYLNDYPEFSTKKKEKLLMRSSHARLKKARKGTEFLVLTTPYIKSLRISLQRSHKRPVNSIEKECFIISRKYFETFVIPSVFLMSTIVTALHYGYLDLTDSDQKIKTISIAYLLLRPSLTIMPFLPWMFPCFWLAVNAYGSARILCCGQAHRKKAGDGQFGGENMPGYSPNWAAKGSGGPMAGLAPTKFENLLATPTAAGSSENKHDEDELHDLSSNIKFMDIFYVTIDLIKGKSGHVWRSSSLLQVLGCLTSLCCIDKVGILSWSNPSPEKVFVMTKYRDDEPKFLSTQHNHQHQGETSSHNRTDESNNQQTIMSMNVDVIDNRLKNLMTAFQDDQISNNNLSVQIKHSHFSHYRPEVLDVSQTLGYRGFIADATHHAQQQQGRLQFDDLNWRKFITNLKPLGLAILMNDCCERSFGDYFRFYKHISYESILRCNLTPVVKRRCLCSLSKLIGFSKDAVENYKYINQIGIYKLIDPSSIKKGKLVPSLENTTRLKLPFPNMICNIHQDITTGGYQVFSQGTADIILDACVEFWDGKRLVSLDESSRKKIMDFYHRTSLTSYCSAFSYTPLLEGHKLNDHYIELPPEDSKVAPQLRKLANEHQEEFLQNQWISLSNPTHLQSQLPSELNGWIHGSQLSSQDNIHLQQLPDSSDDPQSSRVAFMNEQQHITRRHMSYEDLHEINGSNDNSKNQTERNCHKNRGSRKARKLNDTLDELTDQVFVGMVAMQYQACPDFVALVEQLEHACIRFVHFSKENELRSRVFSEKMGLESGWNCHISLRSDQDLDRADKSGAIKLASSNRIKCDEDASKLSNFSPSTRISNILIGSSSANEKLFDSEIAEDNDTTSCGTSAISSDQQTLCSWRSLPSVVMQLSAKLLAEHSRHNNSTPDHNNKHLANKAANQQQLNYPLDSSGDNIAQGGSEFGDDNEQGLDTEAHDSGSVKDDEGFDALAFDMSNRAKLPKGIENIRPHLETVDNVPLQVSLFTDCTPDLTQEMIEIMQDYGEIVCVIGSSSSRLNTPIFLQANASIAIEPLIPQSCTGNDAKLQRSLERKQRKLKKETRHAAQHNRRSHKNNKLDDETESATIQIQTRVNNPRDRLGIGPTEPGKAVLRGRPKRRPSSSSSSSTSSSSSSSSSSRPSSCSSGPPPESPSEFNEDLLIEDGLLGSSNDSQQTSNSLIRELPGPNSLASKLASLPCSYSYNRKDPVNLYGLIMEARHFTFKMKNTFVCMICFALSISSAQFLASILFLPPMLSSGLTIWLTVVVVPLMSFSLMSTTMDSQVMKIAVGKNLQLKPENITFFVLCYLIKFIPSIIVVVLSFGLIIAHSCKLTGFGSSSLGPCWMFTYVQHGNATSSDTGDEDLLWSNHLLTAQVCAAFLLVLYFVVISAGFVHRSHLMWQRSPTRNHLWVIISLALIFGQLLYNQLVLQANLSSSKIPYEFLASLPLHIWMISFMWPILVIGINLLVKRAEIKATIRQQRRARFDFNTKLGMNSPF